MKLWIPIAAILLAATGRTATAEANRPTLLIVVGASGTDTYGKQFRQWADRWADLGRQAKAEVRLIGLEEKKNDDLKTLHAELARTAARPTALWLVLIGHGTFDGRTAKFNLRGPDLNAGDLAGRLAKQKGPVVLINCSASSAPFIPACSGENRVIVTATKSGFEDNFARFGDHLSRAISDPESDLNGDGQVALFEAFVSAADRTKQAYEQDGQLATEHPLIDDNGDGKGSRADWFLSGPPPKQTRAGARLDGRLARRMHLVESELERSLTAEQRAERDRLETQLDRLREKKQDLDPADYDRRLEALLLRIAAVYDAAESGSATSSSDRPKP
ncbi:MAG: hypothetical protein R3236_03415 [Phycisphaeraceae bacterium]|nr:hypothetical protein [Phycisphaeraceae bacterium]